MIEANLAEVTVPRRDGLSQRDDGAPSVRLPPRRRSHLRTAKAVGTGQVIEEHGPDGAGPVELILGAMNTLRCLIETSRRDPLECDVQLIPGDVEAVLHGIVARDGFV